MNRTIGVIGAGPAGIMAALQAAHHGATVTVYDGNTFVGRKLRLTGSGRCNVTNQRVSSASYACAAPSFTGRLLARFGYAELVSFLDEHLIPVYATPDGWCYPISQSAAAVADNLGTALTRAGVVMQLGRKITDIHRVDGAFELVSEAGVDRVTRVVVAAGGAAYPQTGSRGELYPVLERLGHSLVPLRPALAPLVAEVRSLHKLQGVRLDVRLRLLCRETMLGETLGNIILTQWGLNGPAAMDLSHLIDPAQERVLEVNWLGEAESYLSQRIDRFVSEHWPARTVLQSVLPPKVPPVLLGLAGISEENPLSTAAWRKLWPLLTAFRLRVTGTKDFHHAQCTAGGIPGSEVDPESMRSLIIPGLFLAGEMLDVVGPCGGYNLQFAFSSGAVAGIAAAQF